MAILASEIQVRISGGSSNTNPLLSLGGVKSSTQVGTDIFDTVDGAESASGDIEYRCVYLHNANASETAVGVAVWIPTNTTSSFTEVQVGSGTSAVNAVEQVVATEGTTPTGVSFGLAATEGAAVILGDIPAGQHKSFWLRRSVTAGATSLNSDSFTYRIVWQS